MSCVSNRTGLLSLATVSGRTGIGFPNICFRPYWTSYVRLVLHTLAYSWRVFHTLREFVCLACVSDTTILANQMNPPCKLRPSSETSIFSLPSVRIPSLFQRPFSDTVPSVWKTFL